MKQEDVMLHNSGAARQIVHGLTERQNIKTMEIENTIMTFSDWSRDGGWGYLSKATKFWTERVRSRALS